MYYRHTTQVPNELFDRLSELNQSQLKTILIVLRQTLGWIDPKTNKRKYKDWISINFFVRRTGLTRKSVSFAIQQLIDKKLLIALDYRENQLQKPRQRQGKKKIYYTYAPYYRTRQVTTSVKKLSNLFTYRHKTKLTPTKLIKQQNHFPKNKLTNSKQLRIQQQRKDT